MSKCDTDMSLPHLYFQTRYQSIQYLPVSYYPLLISTCICTVGTVVLLHYDSNLATYHIHVHVVDNTVVVVVCIYNAVEYNNTCTMNTNTGR